MWSGSSWLPWWHVHQEGNYDLKTTTWRSADGTCQSGGTLQTLPASSWPSAGRAPSCPRRNTPPHGLWAAAPVVSSEGDRSASPLRCCRSCLSEQCISLPVRPAPWRPPCRSRRSFLKGFEERWCVVLTWWCILMNNVMCGWTIWKLKWQTQSSSSI